MPVAAFIVGQAQLAETETKGPPASADGPPVRNSG